MRIYLAGPMRGYPRHNFPAFLAAAAHLREAGYEVVSPAEHDLDLGFDPELSVEEQGFDLAAAFTWDIQQVLACEAIVLLPGYENSTGAMIELNVARMCGKAALHIADLLAT